MRFLLRLVLAAVALVVLLAVGFFADVAFNQRRLSYALLGRDALLAACRPPLEARLRSQGFEPGDIEFGATPDIAVSSSAGRTLDDDFTFADGASQTRVDGTLACSIKGGTVTIEVLTATTPTRAT